ncbi:MAG: glycerol kinase GlpK [Chloroflexi bacterium]|nr:glycerol kinase GlpK [Chloroflexota bacterium]
MVLALDSGTSSSRALAWDEQGRVVALAQRVLPSRYPKPGWVEQSGEEIFHSQLEAARDVVRDIGVQQIRCVALANQRETSLLWDRTSREALGPAIVWQCRRTAGAAAELLAARGDEVRVRSGLRPDAYFSGLKFAWLLDHVPGARDRAARGDLVAGTVDTWLLANLTDGDVFATDRTNASRTMLWNLTERRWDAGLCEWQQVPDVMLPEVRPSAHEYGHTAPSLFGAPLPILAVAGDQQAALYGHGIQEPGRAKCTYGTGAFILTHAGESVEAASPPGLLLTASADGGLALEGGVFTAGSVVQWLRDELGLAATALEISALAEAARSSQGVILIPALAGLGSPHWDADARGAILGITRGTTAGQIARAALESIAFRVREVVEAMEAEHGNIDELRVDGGMSSSDTLLQIQSNALQRPVIRPAIQETTALGAARLAAEAAGGSLDLADASERFEPTGELEQDFDRWSTARRAIHRIAGN